MGDVLTKFGLEKHTALYRQKGQLRTYFLKNTESQNYILNFLNDNKKQEDQNVGQDQASAVKDNSYPENTEEILRQGFENAINPGPRADNDPCTDRANRDLLQDCEEESDCDLPTPPYVPLQQLGVSEQGQTERNRWNLETWDRQRLSEYIKEHAIQSSNCNTTHQKLSLDTYSKVSWQILTPTNWVMS